MKYLLDTNTCIRHLNERSESITRKLGELSTDAIAVCSVVKAELFYGAIRSHSPEQTLAGQKKFVERFVSLPFDDRAADIYAKIRAQLATAGRPIGPNDVMIAGIAISNNLILVTHNIGEFGRVEGLGARGLGNRKLTLSQAG
jgi:tRNA(fMet)-specific endonuclease VapC